MNSFVMLASASGNPIGEVAGQFGVTWQLLISQVILFALVALALKKFAYGPLLAMLEERKQRIAEGIANADKIKAELASAQAKAQEVVGQAAQQATKIIEEARAAGSREVEKASQAAIATANQIIAKAKEANEAELVRMKNELRKEMGRLVVQTSSRVTGNILTSEQQTRLAEDAAKQLVA
jgi:F-type H+-transporting ATPase subunit b